MRYHIQTNKREITKEFTFSLESNPWSCFLLHLPINNCFLSVRQKGVRFQQHFYVDFYQAEFLSEMAYSQLSFLLISFQIRLFNVPLLYPGQRMRQRSHLFRQCYDRFYCLAAKGTETKSPKDEFKIQNCAFSGQTADQHFYDRFFASQPRALGQSPENKLKIKNVFFSWLKQKMRDTQYFLRLLLQINNQIKI